MNHNIQLYPGESAEITICFRDEHGRMQDHSTVSIDFYERESMLEISHQTIEDEATWLTYWHQLPPSHEADSDPAAPAAPSKAELLELAAWIKQLEPGMHGPVRIAQLLEDMASRINDD